MQHGQRARLFAVIVANGFCAVTAVSSDSPHNWHVSGLV
jgi:hypothetical protein